MAATQYKQYAKTISMCPVCAKDVESHYEERPDGMFLHIECSEHGHFVDKAENDAGFFKRLYEHEYAPDDGHLVLPITYRCNLKCRYCYTLSNSKLEYPEDRPTSRILEYSLSYGKSTNLIGGEPTVREDLFDIISAIKERDPGHILSIGTNGQRLNDPAYVRELKERGLDFVFLSLNDPAYEPSREAYTNKVAALENCLKTGLPVWLQRTVDRLEQIDSMLDILEEFKKGIFHITMRAAKPIGATHPSKDIYISDMLRHLKKEKEHQKGRTPFNCHVKIMGKKTKLCSWVNDTRRIDPIDWGYVTSDGELTTFFRGMRADEMLVKSGGWRSLSLLPQ